MIILNNKPAIIIHDKEEEEEEEEKGTCMFIDTAISGGRNVMKKEAEKILKYKDVTVTTQCLWNAKKTNVISVIIGAAVTISD